MVDPSSYNLMDPYSHPYEAPERDKLQIVPDAELHFCAPTVLGYSFTRRKWGRFKPTGFSEIQWSTDAFDYLVLPKPKKTLIRNLVVADGKDLVTDVVSGKGGGCLLILYGPPGTGKTLTAEAIADELRRPLMVVSAGELGNSAPDIEQNFTSVLNTARLWNAIMLLDEADVFLDSRSRNDHYHNAIVGTFLRLLEYHHQVIFLTTNRIATLDDAVRSRVSVAIEYPDLNRQTRKDVWRKVLEKSGIEITEIKRTSAEQENKNTISEFEIGQLSNVKLNGR
jgi:DNA replication protein DnaC